VRSRIGECLVQAGLVSDERLRQAIAEQSRTGERLGAVLVRLGIATESQIAQTLAAQLGFRYADLADEVPDPGVARLIEKPVATQAVCVGISLQRNVLTIAMAEPLLFGLVSDLERRTGYRIRQVVATPTAIQKAIESVYSASAPAADAAEASSDDEPIPEDLLGSIVAGALDRDATDIHVDPPSLDGSRQATASHVRGAVRYRVDGVLTEAMRLPSEAHEELVARIKIMAGLDVAERLLPQSGRLRFPGSDFRVTTLRGIDGERLVLRGLDRRRHTMDLDSLGLTAIANNDVRRWLRDRRGLILIVGPPGSGRTTTIYAAARAFGPDRGAIVSIEDPVECRLPGLVQTEVDSAVGLTFSAALRAAIAQAPEILAIGDLADAEAATLAALTARSDRLVVAALGGDDAVSGLMRLSELVGPTLAAASITGIVAQRVVRRLCGRCRIEFAVPADLLRSRGIEPTPGVADETPRFFKAAACDQCAHSGYRGQIGIFETLTVTDAVRELLVAGAPAASLRAAAASGGFVTLEEDAMAKARSGVTTLDEIVRVLGDIGETRPLCASCGGAVAADFIACPRCGTRLGRNCASCGRALQAGWTFCPYCAAAADAGGQGQKRGIMRLIRNSDRTRLWPSSRPLISGRRT
jgi:type IV pilus assembly protein PilB